MKEIQKFKCVIIGNPAVGKTSITQSFINEGNKFLKSYNLTTGVEISLKNHSHRDIPCELLIIDTSGYELYVELLTKVCKDVDIFVVVFDVSNEESLENTATWVQTLKQCNNKTNINGVLFANKTDLISRRKIPSEKSEMVAKRLNLIYMEGSAKEYDGINEIFNTLIQEKIGI